MAVIWNMSCKNESFEQDTLNQCFFKLLLYQLPGHAIFFYFLVSVINHYHINGLHLFSDSFEWFCLQIRSDAKYFFLLCPRHCDQGLIVVILYYFQIWNKKECYIIIRRVISRHMGPMYSETPNIYVYWDILYQCILSHLILMYIDTPYINVFWDILYFSQQTDTYQNIAKLLSHTCISAAQKHKY